MKTKLAALALLGVGTMFAGPRIGVSIGVGSARPYGYYAPGPAYVAPAPVYVAPAPAYANGYWYYVGNRRYWHEGRRIAPRFHEERFEHGRRR